MFRFGALTGIFLLLPFFHAGSAFAAPKLVEQLRHGGYVLLMRHASAPQAVPDKQSADPENKRLERQLDAKGRATAAAMGQAIKSLRIPVGTVFSSPTYRARQTVRFAGLGEAKAFAQLGDKGSSMEKDAVANQAAWLREKVSEAPKPGVNTIIVTHMPNIVTAFPDAGSKVAEGETLIFQPRSGGKAVMIAKVPIEEWPNLAR
jgi:phosphohistidine phosphatase SixA